MPVLQNKPHLHFFSLFFKIALILLLVILIIISTILLHFPLFFIALISTFCFLLAAYITHFLIKPIETLNTEISDYFNGEQPPNSFEMKTGDEIEQLASSVNQLITNYNRVESNNDQTQKQLSLEKNELSLVLSGIADGIIVVDKNRNITAFSSGAVELTGVTQEQAIHKPIDQVLTLYDKGILVPLEQFCPTDNNDEQKVFLKKEELKLISVAKKEVFVNLSAGHINQPTNPNIGCIIALHDVTKEKQLKDMQLDFVSMAAHELRTPLTSLRGYLSVMTDENKANIAQNKPHLSKDQEMFLYRIDVSSKQLLDLVENLLNVSRIERGVFTIKLEETDWVEIVRQAVMDQQAKATSKNLHLEMLEPTDQIPKIKVDKLRINELLANLIANAINYTNPGGQITVTIEKNSQEIITHIKDTGIGIKKEALPHLFNKFFRAQDSLTQSNKGTGIGLYISKAIVTLHKGKIWVDSEEGKGSTFSFSLPII